MKLARSFWRLHTRIPSNPGSVHRSPLFGTPNEAAYPVSGAAAFLFSGFKYCVLAVLAKQAGRAVPGDPTQRRNIRADAEYGVNESTT